MLVSLEEAREYLRIDEDDTSNDDLILSSLETAQALCLDLARCEEADAEESQIPGEPGRPGPQVPDISRPSHPHSKPRTA